MSTNWWFGAFRDHGAPTWYGDNRTPVITDSTTVTVSVAFGILLFAFFVIFPGIRRTKLTSLLTVTLAIIVGALLIICGYYPAWHVADVYIMAPYKSFSPERVNAILGVHVGLQYVNITLKGFPENKEDRHMDYNFRFGFYDAKSMQNDLREGLEKGLPFPVLTVIEYLSVDRAGFAWGRRYRLAGYYTSIILWLSFALWLLHLIVLCLAPKYYSRLVICIGVCILTADIIYVMSCPKTLLIPFSNALGFTEILIFQFGWCLWATLSVGLACFIYGIIIYILEVRTVYKFFMFIHEYDEDYAYETPIFSVKTTKPLLRQMVDNHRRHHEALTSVAGRQVHSPQPTLLNDGVTTTTSGLGTSRTSFESPVDRSPPRKNFDQRMIELQMTTRDSIPSGGEERESGPSSTRASIKSSTSYEEEVSAKPAEELILNCESDAAWNVQENNDAFVYNDARHSEHSRKESVASSQKSSASIKSVLLSYKRHRQQGASESSTSSATSSQRGRKRKVKSKPKFSDACLDKFVIRDDDEDCQDPDDQTPNQVNNCSDLTLRADHDKCRQIQIDIVRDDADKRLQFTLDIDNVLERCQDEAGPSSGTVCSSDVFRPILSRSRLTRRNSNLPPLQSMPRLLQDYRPPTTINYSNLEPPPVVGRQKIIDLTFPGFDDVDDSTNRRIRNDTNGDNDRDTVAIINETENDRRLMLNRRINGFAGSNTAGKIQRRQSITGQKPMMSAIKRSATVIRRQ